jgi:hypothetical protein
MDETEASPPRKWTRVRTVTPWSPALGEAICARVAAGELLYAVLREPGMPTPQSVGRWARDRAGFGAALMAARAEGGRPSRGGGGVWTYCPETVDALFERLVEGESLTGICRDATMPTYSTVYYWRRKFPEFDRVLRMAREIQAERFCDEGYDLAMGASPETAYLTHVRLTQLRWMAAVRAPRIYKVKPVEPEETEEPLRVLIRTFKMEVDPETGKEKVVSFCPNPDTGQMERDNIPGYVYPPNSQPLPAGPGWA